MRITVSLAVNLIASGMSADEIIDAYPYLEAEDVRQSLQYLAWLAEEAVHPLKLSESDFSDYLTNLEVYEERLISYEIRW